MTSAEYRGFFGGNGWFYVACLCMFFFYFGFALQTASADPGEEVDASVALIVNYSAAGTGTGTGFYVSPDGYMITNEHVVKGYNRLEVKENKTGVVYQVRLLWSDADYDLALLKVATSPPAYLELFAGEIIKGTSVWAVGFPGASNRSVTVQNLPWESSITAGEVSKVEKGTNWNLGRGSARFDLIYHYAKILPGNSGGPLIDECNHVVGINSAGTTAEVGSSVLEADHLASAVSDTLLEKLTEFNVAADITSTACVSSEDQLSSSVDELKKGSRLQLMVMVALGVLTSLALFVALRKPGFIPRGKNSRWSVSPKLDTGGGASAGSMLTISGAVGENAFKRVNIPLMEIKEGSGISVGRDADLVDYTIEDSRISKRQFRFIRDGGKLFIEDLNSSNKTRLNGVKLVPFEPVPLATAATLEIGGSKMSVRYGK